MSDALARLVIDARGQPVIIPPGANRQPMANYCQHLHGLPIHGCCDNEYFCERDGGQRQLTKDEAARCRRGHQCH